MSTDAEIIKRAKLSVPEIVKQFGWDHFRDLESAVCRDFAAQERLIIDTGGGAILRSENVEALRRSGTAGVAHGDSGDNHSPHWG